MANYYLFRCTDATYSECIDKMLFGQQSNNDTTPVANIQPNDIIFLHKTTRMYNIPNQFIEGPFWAVSEGKMNIDSSAWNGRFPWQVKVEKRGETNTIPQKSFHSYLQYEVSGRFFKFVIPQDVGRNLMDAFGYSTQIVNIENNTITLSNNDLTPEEINFRLKYPAIYRSADGHFVRSTFEVIVDDWLYNNRIVHAYEKIVPGCRMTCDFHVRSKAGNEHFVEVWGMDTPYYLQRKEEKKQLYRSQGIEVISIERNHIRSIDDFLSELKHKFDL